MSGSLLQQGTAQQIEMSLCFVRVDIQITSSLERNFSKPGVFTSLLKIRKTASAACHSGSHISWQSLQ